MSVRKRNDEDKALTDRLCDLPGSCKSPEGPEGAVIADQGSLQLSQPPLLSQSCDPHKHDEDEDEEQEADEDEDEDEDEDDDDDNDGQRGDDSVRYRDKQKSWKMYTVHKPLFTPPYTAPLHDP